MSQRPFKRDDYIVYLDPDTQIAQPARILHADYAKNAHIADDAQPYEKDFYRIVTADNTQHSLPARMLYPLKDATTHIDTEHFGDTPDSARTWLANLTQRLEEADEWGHTYGGTADPHYWGIMTICQSIVVDPQYEVYDNIEFIFDDDTTSYLAPDAIAWVEDLIACNDACTAYIANCQKAFDSLYIKDWNICFNDNSVLTPKNDNYTQGVYLVGKSNSNNTRFMTDAELNEFALILIELIEHDNAMPYIHLEHTVYSQDVYGLLPNAMFLTLKDCQDYIEHQKHNLHQKAHPYLMCDYKDQTFTRLSRILRQVDWENSCLSMRTDTINYPQ